MRTNAPRNTIDMKNRSPITRNLSAIIQLLKLLMCIIGAGSDRIPFSTCYVDNKCIALSINVTTEHHISDGVGVFATSTTHRVNSQSLRVLSLLPLSTSSLTPLFLPSYPDRHYLVRSMLNMSPIVVLLLTSLIICTMSSEIEILDSSVKILVFSNGRLL